MIKFLEKVKSFTTFSAQKLQFEWGLYLHEKGQLYIGGSEFNWYDLLLTEMSFTII